MEKHERIFSAILYALILLALLAMVIAASPFIPENNNIGSGAKAIDTWNARIYDSSGNERADQPEFIRADTTTYDLSEGDSVELTAHADLTEDSSIYVTTFYSPYRFYINGQEIASYGADGTYPFFMPNPPSDAHIYSVDGTPNTEIKILFTIPQHSWNFRVGETYTGTYDAILLQLFYQMGAELFLGCNALAIGLTMVILGIYTRRLHKRSRNFLWFGTLLFSIGLWVTGECDLTCALMKHPSLLYVLTYMGLFCILIPIANLTYQITEYPESRFGRYSCLFVTVFTIVLVALQFLGICAFTESVLAFYIVGTILIFAIFAHTVTRVVRKHEHLTKLNIFFLIGLFLFGVCLALELVNYYLIPITHEMIFADLGVSLFIFFLALSSARYIKEIVDSNHQAEELAIRLEQEQTLAEVKQRQHLAIIEANQELKRMRHDLKHHLGVLQGYCEQGDPEGMKSYIANISSDIPTMDGQKFCADFAVNSIISYYVALAHERELDIEVTLDTPELLDISCESDLCSIIGNIMENGIRAATQAQKALHENADSYDEKENAFIRLYGRTSNGIITITQDNSYFKVEKNRNGDFVSTRNSNGIGLKSIKRLAQKWNGNARFEADEKTHVFKSSIYVQAKLREQLS